jgi:uncharacterized Zn finger protein (UPF0148 family)
LGVRVTTEEGIFLQRGDEMKEPCPHCGHRLVKVKVTKDVLVGMLYCAKCKGEIKLVPWNREQRARKKATELTQRDLFTPEQLTGSQTIPHSRSGGRI